MIFSIDAEKTFDKIQHPFKIKKTLNKMGVEGIDLNLIKVIYDKPTANTLDGKKVEGFSSEIGNKIRMSALTIFFFLSFVFCPFRAAPVAYGGSRARGLIGAVAAGLHQSHNNARSKPRL